MGDADKSSLGIKFVLPARAEEEALAPGLAAVVGSAGEDPDAGEAMATGLEEELLRWSLDEDFPLPEADFFGPILKSGRFPLVDDTNTGENTQKSPKGTLE